jgi:cell wall-associated NlpC family hydrolase
LSKYNLGAKPSPFDVRDYSVVARLVSANLPDEFLLDIFPEVYDQESETCVSQSIRSIYRNHFGDKFGVNYLYALGRSYYNGPGMYPREAADFAVKNGLALLKDDPKEYEMPEAASMARASKSKLDKSANSYKGGSWGRPTSADIVKIGLLNNKPSMACFSIKTWNPASNGVWDCSSANLGFHEMFIIGWKKVNGKEYAIVRNSWGKGWGKKVTVGSKSSAGCSYIAWNDVFRNNDVITFDLPGTKKSEDISVRRTLRYTSPRMEGDDVKLCQERLNAHGFKITVTGTYRSATKFVVEKFQKSKGVVVDGIVGDVTWKKLLANPSNKQETKKEVNLKHALVDFCKDEIGMVYCWGRMGQENLTDKQIRSAETSEANALRVIKFVTPLRNKGKIPIRYFDCSGLISAFLKKQSLIQAKRNCNHLADMCIKVYKRGSNEDITSKLEVGDLVFRWNLTNKYYHVGVYAGNGKVIEAKGRDDGVVIRDINASGSAYWNRYGKLKCLEVN